MVQIVSTVSIASPVCSLRFDATGEYLVALGGSRDDAQVYRVDGARLVHHGTLRTAIESDSPLAMLGPHPTEPRVAIAGQDRTLSVWDLRSCATVGEIAPLQISGRSPERGYWGVAYSPDGHALETHSLAELRGLRFDADDGRESAARFGPGGPLAYYPGGELLAVCSTAEMGTTTWLGRWESNVMRWYEPELVAWFPTTRVVFTPGALAFIGGSGALAIQLHGFPECDVRWTLELGVMPDEAEFPFLVSEALAAAPNGDPLFVGTPTGEVSEVGARDGNVVRSWPAHEALVTSLDVHPARAWIATGGADGTIVLSADDGRSWLPRPPASHLGRELERFRTTFAVLPNDEPTFGPCRVFEP